MSSVQHIKIEMFPEYFFRRQGLDLHRVQIKVRTYSDQYEISEVIPDDDFVRRFDWLIDRAKREIAAIVAKESE